MRKILFAIFPLLFAYVHAQEDSLSTLRLDEVKISIHPKTKKIKFLRSTNFLGGMILTSGREILTCIYPKKDLKGKHIKNIYFKIKKEFFPSKSTKAIVNDIKKNYLALLRIRIYEKNENASMKEIFVSDTIAVRYLLDRIIALELPDNFLLEEEGLCLGLEFLGYKHRQTGKIENRFYFRVTLTGKRSKFYKQETFLRFSRKEKPFPIQEFFKKTGVEKKYWYRNLSVALSVI